ncbi:MipA/OmpV family protein [Noviherbaspirillum aerium]|uniref:MipA/OmpV family protein n=1 Tax=Noviherbaspirillum aerium TaxID=2588497 RepID=UPI001CEFAD7D|nr:MipA/OmpV family protein [Noviherbaspirillum aerium]
MPAYHPASFISLACLPRAALLFFLHAMTVAADARADTQPRWEVGLGLGVLSVPDYRGADTRSSYLLPAPYFVYRGDILQADRSGMRAALFENERVEVNLSLNASLPGRSDNNALRQGMEKLRPILEAGPTADLRLWSSERRHARLDLRLPVRAALTVESSPRHVGWLFSPNLLLRLDDPAGFAGWKLGLQAGPVYGSREYNGYVYGVGAAEARPGRPAYSAPGGYAGMQAAATLSKRYSRYWVGAFLRYDHLGGATFADSPLVRQRSAVTAGLAVSWIFGQSAAMVQSDD